MVGHQVAHAVDHPLPSDVLDRLDDMGVMTQEEVDVRCPDEPRRHLCLLGVGIVVVLGPPVQGDDDDLGPPPRAGRVGQDLLFVDLVGPERLAGRVRDPIEAVRVGEQTNLTGPSVVSTSTIVVCSASDGVRADPAWAIPAASSASRVLVTPPAPWSKVWLDAVLQAS